MHNISKEYPGKHNKKVVQRISKMIDDDTIAFMEKKSEDIEEKVVHNEKATNTDNDNNTGKHCGSCCCDSDMQRSS